MSLKLAVYIETNGINILKEKTTRERFDDYLKQLGIEKVYLEIFRGHEGEMRFSGKFLENDDVKDLKNYYENKGIEIAGGLCIGTWSEGFGKQAVDQDGNPVTSPCYSAMETEKFYREVARRTAVIFKEVLIDDFLFTGCFCQGCLDLFNSRFGHTVTRMDLNTAIAREEEKLFTDWVTFNCELISDFSRKITESARKANPEVKFNWKLPEWNNHFYVRGIDLHKIKDIYDAFYIGTEAREGAQRYAGFHSFRYLNSIMGEKAVGVWFDILNGWDYSLAIGVERYVNQFKMSVLSGAREVVLFCFPEVIQDGREAHLKGLVRILHQMKELSKIVKGHIGLPVRRRQSVQALHSPEGYLFDHLGTMGIPIKPVSEEESKNIELVTIHSADLDYRGFLQRGGKLIVTSDAAQRMVSQGKSDILGVSVGKPVCQETVMVNQFITGDGRIFSTGAGHERDLLVPVGPVFCPDTAEPVLTAMGKKDEIYPVILRNKYLKGEILIYCLTKFPLYLHTFYPEVTRQILRDYLAEVIGVKVSSASKLGTLPPVGVFPMEKMLALVNYNSYPINLFLWINPHILGGKIDTGLPVIKEVISNQGGWLQWEIFLQSEEMKVFPFKNCV